MYRSISEANYTLLLHQSEAIYPKPPKSLPKGYIEEDEHCHGWLFIGEKQENRNLADIYRKRVLSLPKILGYENSNYCLGANAFRTWASNIENGCLDKVRPEEFDNWDMYTVYVCCLATNSLGCKEFLEKTLKLNPDMVQIRDIISLYAKTGLYWNNDNGTDLEALGGGFNITLENLQDTNKRKRIADKLRDFASCMDKVVIAIEHLKAL